MARTGQRAIGKWLAALIPSSDGKQRLSFFMLENLLRARAESSYPTSSRCQDEDVNVYMAHLLTEHLRDPIPPGIVSGAEPLLPPEDETGWDRWRRIEHFRHNGDHRLICLGLYGRGDLIRRRSIPFGFSPEEIYCRDLEIGRHCYLCAVILLQSAPPKYAGLLSVMRKLAAAYAEYVHVLQTLARRRFGFGARISDRTLCRLLSSEP